MRALRRYLQLECLGRRLFNVCARRGPPPQRIIDEPVATVIGGYRPTAVTEYAVGAKVTAVQAQCAYLADIFVANHVIPPF